MEFARKCQVLLCFSQRLFYLVLVFLTEEVRFSMKIQNPEQSR